MIQLWSFDLFMIIKVVSHIHMFVLICISDSDSKLCQQGHTHKISSITNDSHPLKGWRKDKLQKLTSLLGNNYLIMQSKRAVGHRTSLSRIAMKRLFW
jgi:hypothetical protein